MKKSRILALVLSFNFGIFGGNTFAGNGDPLKEHMGLIDKYLKEEKKYAQIYDITTTNEISYRRKEDFFSYDELRAITIHNAYSAFSGHNGIVPNYCHAVEDTFEILGKYVKALHNGNYKLKGDNEVSKMQNFFADVSAELALRKSIVGLGRGLYGDDVFHNDDCIDIANGVVVSMMGISLDIGYSKVGLALDIIDIVLWVATIATIGASAYGHIVKAGINAGNAAFWAQNGVRKVSQKTAEKIAAGVIKANPVRSLGYKALNGVYKAAPNVLVTTSEFLRSMGIQHTGKIMAIGAVAVGTLASKGIITGTKDTVVLGLAKNSKNSINTNGTFSLSVQLKKQRVNNIAVALSQLSNQIINCQDEILNSNILVCALDRRNLNTWLPILSTVNRVKDPQTSWLRFKKVTGVLSPTVRNCKNGFESILKKFRRILVGVESVSKNFKDIINNNIDFKDIKNIINSDGDLEILKKQLLDYMSNIETKNNK